LVALLGATWPALAFGDDSSLRLAVAPFEGETGEPPLSARLASIFAEGPHERLLPPGSFVAEPGLTPSAEAVRAWAYNAAVDDVLLGRVHPATEFSPARLDVVLRSGHSGAERWRRSLVLPAAGSGTGAGAGAEETMLRSLASAVRAALGEEATKPGAGRVEGAAAGPSRSPAAAGRGLEASLDLSGFDSDAPIEINAEEAEIVSRNRGRDLVFRRNVEVRQANVTLRSDRLEATYRKGESEPERLVAQGRVLVDQGGRRARCDRAIYLRAAQQLTCSGHAELVQGCDVVRGDSIEFDLADDRARVEGAASIVIRPRVDRNEGCVEAGGVL
jgi:lipopolysaccharide transport protein LptA